MDKSEIRTRAKELRRHLSEEKLAASGQEIVSNLINNMDLEDFDEYLFYHPLPGEVSLLPLVPQLLSIGKQVAFPKVVGDEIEFYLIRNLDTDFEKGTFQVMEPVTQIKASYERCACLVPGLSYDASLYRVGYGKGYYDTFFEKYPEVYRIGICPNLFFVPEIPTIEPDRPMDIVVTETTIYKI